MIYHSFKHQFIIIQIYSKFNQSGCIFDKKIFVQRVPTQNRVDTKAIKGFLQKVKIKKIYIAGL